MFVGTSLVGNVLFYTVKTCRHWLIGILDILPRYKKIYLNIFFFRNRYIQLYLFLYITFKYPHRVWILVEWDAVQLLHPRHFRNCGRRRTHSLIVYDSFTFRTNGVVFANGTESGWNNEGNVNFNVVHTFYTLFHFDTTLCTHYINIVSL